MLTRLMHAIVSNLKAFTQVAPGVIFYLYVMFCADYSFEQFVYDVTILNPI